MIDNLITALYLLTVLLIGIWAGRKVRNIKDCAGGGNQRILGM